MLESKIKAVNLSGWKHQLVTMPMYVALALFFAGWAGKSFIAEQLGFVTQLEAAENGKQMEERLSALSTEINAVQTAQTEHITEWRFSNAFQTERALQNDLNLHMANPQNTSAWLETKNDLETKLSLAHEYRECVMAERPNCGLIQKQLWQP